MYYPTYTWDDILVRTHVVLNKRLSNYTYSARWLLWWPPMHLAPQHLCPGIGSSHTDFGPGHVTCLGQAEVSKRDASWGLVSTCTWKLSLLTCSWDPAAMLYGRSSSTAEHVAAPWTGPGGWEAILEAPARPSSQVNATVWVSPADALCNWRMASFWMAMLLSNR